MKGTVGAFIENKNKDDKEDSMVTNSKKTKSKKVKSPAEILSRGDKLEYLAEQLGRIAFLLEKEAMTVGKPNNKRGCAFARDAARSLCGLRVIAEDIEGLISQYPDVMKA